jgi:hypothetical protein
MGIIYRPDSICAACSPTETVYYCRRQAECLSSSEGSLAVLLARSLGIVQLLFARQLPGRFMHAKAIDQGQLHKAKGHVDPVRTSVGSK